MIPSIPFYSLSRFLPRARAIREAVLTGMNAGVSDPQLMGFLHRVSLIITEWLHRQPLSGTILLEQLQNMSRSAPLSPNVHVVFVGARGGLEYRGHLFLEALHVTVGRSSGLRIETNVEMDPDMTRHARSPQNSVMPPTHTVLDHVEDLKGMILHELVHREQGEKFSRVRQQSRVLPYMGDTFHEVPIAVFQGFARRERRQNPQGPHIAKSLFTGPDQTHREWYYGQPEEIMAHAVEIGNILTRPPGGADAAKKDALDRLAGTVKHYTTGGSGIDTPAYKRFKKYLAEYLIREKHMHPRDVSDLITRTFSAYRY